MGDSYSGFNYLYCALVDDIYLNKVCPTFNYPKEAPSNKTISLNTSTSNFMQPFVMRVKTYLHSHMECYKETNPTFNVDDFDTLFLENEDFIYIKVYFVYCIWSMFDNVNKYEFLNPENIFNKQTNLSSLFNLSLILDNVLKHYQTLHKENFDKANNIMYGDRLKKYIETSKMDNTYYSATKKKYENKDLDISLKELLKDEPDIKKKEVNYLLTSLLLRNFVAHKVEVQDISLSPYFRNIFEAQMYSLIMILRFYNPM